MVKTQGSASRFARLQLAMRSLGFVSAIHHWQGLGSAHEFSPSQPLRLLFVHPVFSAPLEPHSTNLSCRRFFEPKPTRHRSSQRAAISERSNQNCLLGS